MRICELKCKEVINECNCKRLGIITDIDFDIHTGKVCSVIVPECSKGFNFFSKESEYVIPFECICQIGDDIVLVKTNVGLDKC